MTDFSDLIVARSQVEIRTDIYDSLAADGVTVEGLQEESLLRALPEVFSRIEADAETTRVALTKAAYPSGAATLSAAPGWMYLHAEDFYQVTPKPALETLGKVSVAAASGAGGSTIGIGSLVFRYGGGSNQILFENTEPFTPNPGGASVQVAVKAQVAGSSGNIGNGATLSLVTAYPGLSVTNPALAGTQTWITRRGRDAEALVKIRDRCHARWADLSFDTTSQRFAQIIEDAFTADDQTNPITRIYVDDSNPLGPGSMALYMARDATPATADDITLVTDYLTPRYAAGHGDFAVYAAAVLTITIDGQIKGPTDSAAALVQVSAALSALAPTYAIGGAVVYAEQIRSALMAGVTGALNVTLSIDEETPIPAGSIVEFSVGSIGVVP